MLDDWKTAKKDFEKLTGKHKPGPKFLLVFRKSSGMESALKECDKQAAAHPINQVKLQTAIDKLKTASTAYFGEVYAAHGIETGGDKEVVTVLSKGLTVLKQSLKKYELHFDAELERARAVSVAGDRERGQLAAEVNTYQSNVKAALAHAKASAAKLQALALKLDANKVKLAVAVKFYNDIIVSKQAAVKLAHAFDGYHKIRDHGGDNSLLRDPEEYLEALDDYMGRGVPTDTGKDDLIAKIHDFDAQVKLVAQHIKHDFE